jgi:hypothetical protein
MTLTALLWQFSYLQVLDFLTTVAFLMMGVREGNPIVQFAIVSAPSPILGLALVKVAALGLGLYCLRLKKQQLLARINILFAVVVAWNLLALIAGAARIAS